MGTKIPRKGVLVLSVNQARIVPSTKLSAAEPLANINEFLKVE